MTPQIFNLSTKWKCVVSIIPQSFNAGYALVPVEIQKNQERERFLRSHWIEGCMGPTGSLGPGKMRKTRFPS